MLRLAFDAKRLFNNFTGLGNYSRTLINNLATQYPEHAYFLYTTSIRKNSQTKIFLDQASFQIRRPQYLPASYWRSQGIKRNLQKDDIQLYHGLSHEIPYGLQRKNIKSVVSIHDLIFLKYPELYPFFDRQIYNHKFKYSCRHADQIIAISESTKKDIINFYDIAEEKIQVIYQNCDPIFSIKINRGHIASVLQKYQIPTSYLLYVGAITARKNLLNIVKSLELLPKDLQLPLVVVGKGKNYKKEVQKYIQQKGLDSLIHFPGHIDQEDLPALYQGAAIFIYPSFYEGFGIPIIESLYSKTPVITSQRSSLPEAGGPNAHYIDPDEPEQISKGIEKILTDDEYRNQMIQKSFEYVQQFNSESSSQTMIEMYQRVLELK